MASDAVDDLLSNLPDLEEVDQREMLKWEKELVGLYVTSHPLDSVMHFIQNPYSNVSQSQELKDDPEAWHGRPVVVVGLVEGVRTLMTRRGEMMGVVTLEDLQGQIDAVLFPRTWSRFGELIVPEAVVRVQGKVDTSRGEPQIIVESVTQDFEVAEEAQPQRMPLSASTPPPWLDAEIEQESLEEEAASDEEDAPEALPVEPPPPPYVAPATAGAAPDAPDLVPQVVGPPPSTVQERPAWAVAESRPPARPATPPAEPSGLVIVRFERSGDAARDRRRLHHIHGLLVSYPGTDRFRIVLCGQGRDVCMDFPNHTTGYSEALAAELRALPGVEVIRQS